MINKLKEKLTEVIGQRPKVDDQKYRDMFKLDNGEGVIAFSAYETDLSVHRNKIDCLTRAIEIEIDKRKVAYAMELIGESHEPDQK